MRSIESQKRPCDVAEKVGSSLVACVALPRDGRERPGRHLFPRFSQVFGRNSSASATSA
jgi:hypothetical protein